MSAELFEGEWISSEIRNKCHNKLNTSIISNSLITCIAKYRGIFSAVSLSDFTFHVTSQSTIYELKFLLVNKTGTIIILRENSMRIQMIIFENLFHS